jgi:hypothetical protein
VYGYIGRDQLARLDTMMNDAEPTVRIAAAASVLRIDSKAR